MYRALCLVLLLAACSSGGGSWPSLARRPIEGPAPLAQGLRRCAAAAVPTCGPALPASPAVSASTAPPAVVAGAGDRGSTPTGSPAVAGTADQGGAPAVPPVPIDDAVAQLTLADRDLGDAATRLAAQRTTATHAVAAGRAAGAGSAAWAQAQVETTALDRIGNQIADIRTRLDGIAGTLAAASVAGTEVAAPLAATGKLIARATALQRAYETAAAGLR